MDIENIRDVEKKIRLRIEDLLFERDSLNDQRKIILARSREIDNELDQCDSTARFFNLKIDIPKKEGEIKKSNISYNFKSESVKSIVLDCMLGVGKNGIRSSEIREIYERKAGVIIHEKTISMTLYRLLKEGLIYRVGHIWFCGIGEEV